MSLLSRLFRNQSTATKSADLAHHRQDIHRGFDVNTNSDIIVGHKFCATIQLRTPLRVLRRHGEIHHGNGSTPPQITNELWEGIWIPISRTFRELGLDIDEPVFTMASDIGLIPQDGGEYLKFLMAVREAAESDGSIEERRAEVIKVLGGKAWIGSIEALQGVEAILAKLFPSFVSSIPRMSRKTEERLIDAGYDSPDAINGASDEQLLSIAGVGSSLLSAMRLAANESSEPSARFIDRVLR